MTGCCEPRGYDQVFGGRFARRIASRYRKRGLDKASRRVVDAVPDGDLSGATVLEIGGGVGDIQIELLRRGAASATNLELSRGYEEEAARLLDNAGLGDRVTRRITDIVSDPGSVEPADVVVLHRVVCCYPDYVGLLGAAADHARRTLVFSHPPRNAAARALVATQNLGLRLMRRQFRVFVHPPKAMAGVLVEHGLRPVARGRAGVWRVVSAARPEVVTPSG